MVSHICSARVFWHKPYNTGDILPLVLIAILWFHVNPRMLFDPVSRLYWYFFLVAPSLFYFNSIYHLGQCAWTYMDSVYIDVACPKLCFPVQFFFTTDVRVIYHPGWIILQWSYLPMFFYCADNRIFYVFLAAIICGILPLSCWTIFKFLDLYLQSSEKNSWISFQLDVCVIFYSQYQFMVLLYYCLDPLG